MMTDLILSVVHHLLIFILAGILAAELVLMRPGLTGSNLRLLARIDGAYGGLAVAILAVGAGRVFYGLKGSEFYIDNGVFWTKIMAFALVGVLSVPPTLRILKWARAARSDPAYRVPDSEIGMMRRFVISEALVFLLIPIFAAAMARGYGY